MKDKLQAMGGKTGVKKALITAFISTQASKDMTARQIAREARVNINDKALMKHIDIMLKRRDLRVSK